MLRRSSRWIALLCVALIATVGLSAQARQMRHHATTSSRPSPRAISNARALSSRARAMRAFITALRSASSGASAASAESASVVKTSG